VHRADAWTGLGVHLLVTQCDVRDGAPFESHTRAGSSIMGSHSTVGDHWFSQRSRCLTPV